MIAEIDWKAVRRPRGEEGDREQDERVGVIVAARLLLPWDPQPPRNASRLLALAPPGARLTYARAWGRKKITVGRAPIEDGGAEISRYVPWELHSVCLRVPGVCWMCWAQPDGGTWKSTGAMARWGDRIYRVTHPQAEALIKEWTREDR